VSGHVAARPCGADAGAVYGALPGINLQLEATNRRVDLVGEGIDVAIRVRPRPFDDSDLVLRVLADRGHCLVAGPALIQRMGNP
jgi:DNA-binding transcriptional LysR family regulator